MTCARDVQRLRFEDLFNPFQMSHLVIYHLSTNTGFHEEKLSIFYEFINGILSYFNLTVDKIFITFVENVNLWFLFELFG